MAVYPPDKGSMADPSSIDPVTTSTSDRAPTYDPSLVNFDEEKDTVQGRVQSIIAKNSAPLRMARTRARQTMNNRGLLNSSLNTQAGEAAAYEYATPIASQDAAASLQNKQFNAGSTNRAREIGVLGRQRLGQIQEQGDVSSRLQEEQSGFNIDEINARGEVESGLITDRSDAEIRAIEKSGTVESGLIKDRGDVESGLITDRSDAEIRALEKSGTIESGLIGDRSQAELDAITRRGEVESGLIGDRSSATLEQIREQARVDKEIIAKRREEEETLQRTLENIEENLIEARGKEQEDLEEARRETQRQISLLREGIESRLLTQQEAIDKALIGARGDEEQELQRIRNENEVQLQLMRNANDISLQQLRGDQQAAISAMQSEYRTLFEANNAAMLLYREMASDINDALTNPDLTPEARQTIVDNIIAQRQAGLRLVGGITNLNLEDFMAGLDVAPVPDDGFLGGETGGETGDNLPSWAPPEEDIPDGVNFRAYNPNLPEGMAINPQGGSPLSFAQYAEFHKIAPQQYPWPPQPVDASGDPDVPNDIPEGVDPDSYNPVGLQVVVYNPVTGEQFDSPAQYAEMHQQNPEQYPWPPTPVAPETNNNGMPSSVGEIENPTDLVVDPLTGQAVNKSEYWSSAQNNPADYPWPPTPYREPISGEDTPPQGQEPEDPVRQTPGGTFESLETIPTTDNALRYLSGQTYPDQSSFSSAIEQAAEKMGKSLPALIEELAQNGNIKITPYGMTFNGGEYWNSSPLIVGNEIRDSSGNLVARIGNDPLGFPIVETGDNITPPAEPEPEPNGLGIKYSPNLSQQEISAALEKPITERPFYKPTITDIRYGEHDGLKYASSAFIDLNALLRSGRNLVTGYTAAQMSDYLAKAREIHWDRANKIANEYPDQFSDKEREMIKLGDEYMKAVKAMSEEERKGTTGGMVNLMEYWRANGVDI